MANAQRNDAVGAEPASNDPQIELGLNAAIVRVRDQQPDILVAKPGTAGPGTGDALPFGPFAPRAHRTLEIGLREWVKRQTGIELGYVEQLYTFGDRGRHAEPGVADRDVADGCVVEGAMRNIFAVIRGELVTPPLSRAFLPGITRAAVLEIAATESIPHAERDLPLTDLYAADEAFLTSSLAEILPVASVDARAISSLAPGAITSRLTDAYRSLVTSELTRLV